MILPEWLIKEEEAPFEKRIKKVYNLQSQKQVAREDIKTNDKNLDKALAREMNNPYYLIDET